MTSSLTCERLRPAIPCLAAPHRQFPRLAGIATRAESVDRGVPSRGQRGHPGPTAGGKTEAAFFPVISQMLAEGWTGLSVLYVSPIRALLNNQEQRLQRYFELVGRRAVCWHGDTSQGNRRRVVTDVPDCLLTTPESLEAILVSAKIDHREFFKNIQVVVIDELHAFAGDDRGWHLLSVISRIQRLASRDLQRIGLSATVGNPAEMLEWLSSGSERQRQVVSPAPVARRAPDVQLDYVGS